MRVKNLIVAAIAAVALTSTARAADAGKLYVGGNIGLAMFHDNDITAGGTATVAYKAGLGFAGALGYQFNQNFRLEGEYAYRKNKVNDIGGDTRYNVLSMTVSNFGLNGYYDFASLKLPVKPFVGAGVGYASGKLSGGGMSSKDSELSYQGIVGLAYPFDPNGNITLQYRYHSSQDFSKDGVTLVYGSSTFFAGVTYAFSL